MAKPNLSLMLVDDSQDILDTFAPPFRNSGFAIEPFSDALLALNYFKANSSTISIVIADARMPGMSGFELAMQIKQIKPKVKVIIMTAFEINKVTLDKIKDTVGFDSLVLKPISSSELLQLVRRFV